MNSELAIVSVPDGVWHWRITCTFLLPMDVYCHSMYHVGIQFRRPIEFNCCVLINPHEILMASAVGHGPHAQLRWSWPGLAQCGLAPEWAALAAKPGRRSLNPPNAPRSAAPAMLYRPLPISARCCTGRGVRHCAAWAVYAQRSDPQPRPDAARS